MFKKLMLGMVLPIGTVAVLILLFKVSFSFKEIMFVSLFQIPWFLMAYLAGWEPRAPTLRRFILTVIVVCGVPAAVLLFSSWAASR